MEKFKDPKLIINKIDNLRKEINKANFNYYVLESPDISDSQYDLMIIELIKIERSGWSRLKEENQSLTMV